MQALSLFRYVACSSELRRWVLTVMSRYFAKFSLYGNCNHNHKVHNTLQNDLSASGMPTNRIQSVVLSFSPSLQSLASTF